MDRRCFLKLSLTGLAAGVAFPVQAMKKPIETGWLSGFKDRQGRYGVAHIDQEYAVSPLFYSDERLHDISFNPLRQEVVAAARRPGEVLYVFSLNEQSIKKIQANSGRHFYGHGVFSADGNLFYSTENDFDAEKGVVGLYDASAGYTKIGEFDSGGIGPHQILRRGEVLVIANGGILTHPDTGRAKLNITEMVPNITLLNAKSGDVISQHHLDHELAQLSLRHIALGPEGVVYVAAQDQIAGRRDIPLVWKLDGKAMTPLSAPIGGWKQFNGYVGSICAMDEKVAVTSPRGGCLYIWDPAGFSQKLGDVCGVAKASDGFLFTTGNGEIWRGDRKHSYPEFQFDNHAISVG